MYKGFGELTVVSRAHAGDESQAERQGGNRTLVAGRARRRWCWCAHFACQAVFTIDGAADVALALGAHGASADSAISRCFNGWMSYALHIIRPPASAPAPDMYKLRRLKPAPQSLRIGAIIFLWLCRR